jgi:hypothetical protein
MDTVPHVPGICALAGGGRNLREKDLTFSVSDLSPPWDAMLPFRRTSYELKETGSEARYRRRADYHIFSVNGQPERDRLVVRGRLLSPFVKYCYFAKIQFAPVGGDSILDYEQCNRRAEEFARHCLPAILKALPTKADVEALASK